MSEITRVYLITGFLGSGKTTFLNRIIDGFPKGAKLMILMNEFGEVGVDGTIIEGDDIDMMEISRGSIFCVCVKTDFIKGLYELSNGIKPDVLLIESTGVANPSDLKRDLKLPIFNDRFQFIEKFCIIDAPHFLDAYEAFVSLEKQIASSTVFIINKTDVASPEVIDDIKKVIYKFHPQPLFYETNYADIPLEKYFLSEKKTAQAHEITEPAPAKMPVLTDAALDKLIDDMLDSPDLEITPPDRLMSVTYQWSGEKIEQVQTMAGNLPSAVVRAKGFLEENSQMYLFNYVMGDWTIEKSEIPHDRIHHKNVLVFIGPPESMPDIEKTLKTGNWINLGVFQPLSQQ